VARNQSNSSTNSRYADLARLAESALPIVHKHGFALTFGEVATAKPNHIAPLGADRSWCVDEDRPDAPGGQTHSAQRAAHIAQITAKLGLEVGRHLEGLTHAGMEPRRC
jgi:hypothetical protein